jgi:gliding motility-associated-like protein
MVNNTLKGTDSTFSWSDFANGDSIIIRLDLGPNHGITCPSTLVLRDTAVMRVYPVPTESVNPDKMAGCEPLSITFNQDPNNTYSWNFGNGTGTGSPVTRTYDYAGGTNGNYTVTLTSTSNKNCTSSTDISITVYEKPTADFSYGPDDISNLSPMAEFKDLSFPSTKVNSWDWSFGDGKTDTQQNPEHMYPGDGSYLVWLRVKTSEGCVDSTMRPLSILESYTFYVPNAFSPNDDGVNDEFGGKGIGITAYEMYVYNRWGEEIYSSTDIEKPWNGKVKGTGQMAQVDVYVYKIIVTDFQKKKHPYVGKVTMVR